jgi:hypothetical protein
MRASPNTFSIETRDRVTLDRWARTRTAPQRVVLRSRIVLLLADGLSAREAARQLRISRHTVDLWRGRFLAGGCDALLRDRPGRGRKRATAASGDGRPEAAADPEDLFRRDGHLLSKPREASSSAPMNCVGQSSDQTCDMRNRSRRSGEIAPWPSYFGRVNPSSVAAALRIGPPANRAVTKETA